MSATPRQMRLTKDLVTLCHRDVAEPVPNPRYDYFTEGDYDRAVAHLLSGRPDGPFWLFAYGSLMWKPAFPMGAPRRAVAHGWRRGFSMRIESHRGTPEQPGYMMCLEPGGQCEGMIFPIAENEVAVRLRELLYRELGSDEALDGMRWIDVETRDGTERALTSYANPLRLDFYSSDRPVAEVAYGLARACGHWGSGAEYLYNTLVHLAELGIYDEHLWELEELVAQEITLLYAPKPTA